MTGGDFLLDGLSDEAIAEYGFLSDAYVRAVQEHIGRPQPQPRQPRPPVAHPSTVEPPFPGRTLLATAGAWTTANTDTTERTTP